VVDCGNLKHLLSFSMARSLVNLQSLSVSECKMMENIFCPEDAEVCGLNCYLVQFLLSFV